jgi:hypothetical protein
MNARKALIPLLALALSAGLVPAAIAQPTTTTALIQYIQTKPDGVAPNGDPRCLISVQPRIEVRLADLPMQFADARSSGNTKVFQDTDSPCEFLLFTSPAPATLAAESPPQQSLLRNGLDNSLIPSLNRDLSRSFNLSSVFLLGSTNLDVSSTSVLVVEHVDSAPPNRTQLPPLFEALYRHLQNGVAGLEGFQVWTWTSRPNHWTTITAFKDMRAYKTATLNSTYFDSWNAIYAFGAAPKNYQYYRLVWPLQGPNKAANQPR